MVARLEAQLDLLSVHATERVLLIVLTYGNVGVQDVRDPHPQGIWVGPYRDFRGWVCEPISKEIHPESIFHGFPSQTEADVYYQAATGHHGVVPRLTAKPLA